MARPRTATAILQLKGSYKKHPERKRKNEPIPTGPLGDPPKFLSKGEKAAWLDLASIIPPGVLMNSDRWAVEIAVRIMAKVRDPKGGIGGKFGASVGEVAQMNGLLSRMGMTPADRSKVGVPERGDEKDPFSEFRSSGAGAKGKATIIGNKPN
jgi:hypothetical protein